MRGSDALADNPAVAALRTHCQHRCPGRSGPWRRCGLALGLAALLVPGLAAPGAWASDSRDHERARAAVQAGQVLPLPALLQRLQRTHPGQVLELELERDGGRWMYEVKLLQADGQLLKLDVDAATGQVLQVKQKHRPKAERDGGRIAAPPEEPAK